MSLKGKAVLAAGGGNRHCAGCLRDLAKQGASLALHYDTTRSKDETTRLRDELIKTHPGIHVTIHGGDLGSAVAVDELFSEVISQHKTIDIVVNSVGMELQRPTSRGSKADQDHWFAYAVFVDEQRRRCVDQLHAESSRRKAA